MFSKKVIQLVKAGITNLRGYLKYRVLRVVEHLIVFQDVAFLPSQASFTPHQYINLRSARMGNEEEGNTRSFG